ncbi:MAG: glcE [Mycobacterium sp.]|nr:glcE [Mycobacterium sp.]
MTATALDRVATGTALTALTAVCEDVAEAGPDDAVDGVPAALVARPASTAEVGGLLGAAGALGLTVVPRGSGTKLTWGRPPERAELIVDLGRMAAVQDHAAGDLIVDVQAGTPLAAVQETVAAAGQRLALDDPLGGATVGGALATNLSGPRRVQFGTARDLLIGVTLVRADGVVAKAGGRVVKNVAGYDLGKLLVGSYGTLGIVTEAVFRLHPLPTARRLVTVAFDRPDDAQRLVQSVLHGQVVPAAIEVDRPPDGPGTVAVLLEGIEEGVTRRAAAARELLGASAEEGEVPDGWGAFPWAEAAGGRATALKATFALSGLARVLGTARAAAEAAGLPLHLRGSGGAGVLYAAVPGGAAAAVGSLVARLRPQCAALGGALVVLDAPAEVKGAVDTWGPVPALDLMRRVKDQFDPERRLAPGRFVGGI